MILTIQNQSSTFGLACTHETRRRDKVEALTYSTSKSLVFLPSLRTLALDLASGSSTRRGQGEQCQDCAAQVQGQNGKGQC